MQCLRTKLTKHTNSKINNFNSNGILKYTHHLVIIQYHADGSSLLGINYRFR